MSTQPNLVVKYQNYRKQWSEENSKQALISFEGLKPAEADAIIAQVKMISTLQADGLSADQIKSFLQKEHGWSVAEADAAFAEINGQTKPQAPPPVTPAETEFEDDYVDEGQRDAAFAAPAGQPALINGRSTPEQIAEANAVQQESNFRKRARLLAERGIPVVPVLAGTKKAFQGDWPNLATTDSAKLDEWGRIHPDANTAAVAQAKIGGVWFLEIDSVDVIKRIESETGQQIPLTFGVRSRPGRGHFYFKQTPASIEMGNLMQTYVKHGDWSGRVNNEYVVGPLSYRADTSTIYEITNDVPPVEAPDWLVAWCVSQKKTTSAPEEIPRDAEGLIPHGYIRGWMLTQAGKLRHQGLSIELIEQALLELVHNNCAPPIDDDKVKAMARSMRPYEPGQNTDILLTQQPTGAIPVVDDPSDYDPRFEMNDETFDPKVYEDISRRFTPYPDPGENDLISRLAKKLVTGTPIPLAYVREPLKAIVLHAIDGKVIHPAHRKLTMRGNYFSLGESETNKTTGLEYALSAGSSILSASFTHPQDLFRYKSEQVFIRSFTKEGTIKRDAQGNVKSGRAGNSSQFLYIKEGGLVASCSEYFIAVFSRLTDLYDQTQASTESMTGGDFEAGTAKASTVMCFTPIDYVKTFGGKGTIGGGGLSRWGLVNPPQDHSYDNKDWKPLSDKEIQDALAPLANRAFNLNQGSPIVLIEEDGAVKVRLETKAMLRNAGKAGKRLLEYFMREQMAQAAMAVDGRLVMTTEQAQYAKRWVEAQVECRLTCWPSDANNQIEAMEHTIRKTVCTHFVSETRLKDACNFYREGSGGWFTFNAARNNMVHSGAIKPTGKTRKGVKVYCPGACTIHPAIN